MLGLTGCSGRVWQTSYNDLVTRTASSEWYMRDLDVLVPESLTVSDAYRFLPGADIVWHGDPDGDRREQVTRIIETAAMNAGKSLRGSRPVRLEVELEHFHAVSRVARIFAPSAVHNLQFKIRLFDARTGRQIIPTDRIRADLPAFTRTFAREAVRAGHTQKKRIVSHLEDVFKGWLRQGPDRRRQFTGLGR